MAIEKALSVLRRLGFTVDEILVYSALAENAGGLTAPQVAEASRVPRERVYHLVEGLQKRGFAEVWPGQPSLFYAVPLEEALGHYMAVKENELRRELVAEERPRIPRVVLLPPGTCCLVKEPKPHMALDVYRGHVRGGARGMAITRLPPDRARERLDVDSAYFWLCHQEGEGEGRIRRLDEILRAVREFSHQPGESVILLDGLEYLIGRSEFTSVLKFVHDLSESVALTPGRVVVPLDPRTLEERQVALLEREMEVIEA
ncbi:MAG: DUF835 domain-containing protein [Euryarchaeota archaeon]|nr:DUF835 domain-containing protein [Euryarchaeota archaeon]